MDSTDKKSAKRGRATIDLPERVLVRAREEAVASGSNCVLTAAPLMSEGYGRYRWRDSGGRTQQVLAHRAAWTALRGTIPEGLTIHHQCHTRPCVNVGHMELVPHAVNARMNRPTLTDSASISADRCVNGHDPRSWYAAPTARHPGLHKCTVCNRENARRHEAKWGKRVRRCRAG